MVNVGGRQPESDLDLAWFDHTGEVMIHQSESSDRYPNLHHLWEC